MWTEQNQLEMNATQSIEKSPYTTVSNRECEILKLVAHEYTTTMISHKLYISPHTVISHRNNLMIKLNAKNAAGLVRRGFELGLLKINQIVR